jgi:hypothetical protein
LHTGRVLCELHRVYFCAAPDADPNAVVRDGANVGQTALQAAISSEIPLADGSRLAVVKTLVRTQRHLYG